MLDIPEGNRRTYVVVPHFAKVAVADLPNGSDLSNPPLTGAAKESAVQFFAGLEFEPEVIFCSTRQRCLDMHEAAKTRFGNASTGGPKAVFLDTLAQTDNLDIDGQTYGPPSIPADWLSQGKLCFEYFEQHMAALELTRALVLSHRPITAGVKAYVLGLGADQVDAHDPELVPYIGIGSDGHKFYLLPPMG